MCEVGWWVDGLVGMGKKNKRKGEQHGLTWVEIYHNPVYTCCKPSPQRRSTGAVDIRFQLVDTWNLPSSLVVEFIVRSLFPSGG
jgi:hypothetical protein